MGFKAMKNLPGQRMILLVVVLMVVAGAAIFLATRTANAPAATAAQALSPAQYQTQFSSDVPHLLLDVRTPEEFAEGYIPGAVNISVQTLEGRMSEVPRDVPVVVYCRSGNRSATAAQMLIDAGYTQVYDLGGIQDWQAQGLPVEN